MSRRHPPKRRPKPAKPRTAGDRDADRFFVIWTEGETEYNYLKKNLGRVPAGVSVQVDARGCGNDPKSLVKMAKDHKKKQAKSVFTPNLDGVWIVCDVESDTDTARHDNLRNARETARVLGFEMFISCPSVEVWFLLHFEDGGGMIQNGDAAKSMLRKHLPGYRGTNIADFDTELLDGESKAHRRAERVMADRTPFDNPSTEMSRLMVLLSNPDI